MSQKIEAFEIEGWTVRGWPYFDFSKKGEFEGDIDADGNVCFDPCEHEKGRGYEGDTAMRREVPWNVVLKARQLWEAHNGKS